MSHEPRHRRRWQRVRDALVAGPAGTLVHPAPAAAPIPETSHTEVLPPAVPPVEPVASGHRRRPATGPLLVAGGRGPAGRTDRLGGARHEGARAGIPRRGRPSLGLLVCSGDVEGAVELAVTRRRTRRPLRRRGRQPRGWSSSSGTTCPPPPPTRPPAYTMLTPAFQQESGGLERYRELLGHGRECRAAGDRGRSGRALGGLHRGLPDGQLGTRLGGSTDNVNLTLAFEDGTYKIAGESWPVNGRDA